MLSFKLILAYFLISIFTILGIVICVAFFTLLERKVLAGIQRRRGPNYVGFWGLLQAVADALKLLFNEITMPSGANQFFYLFSPIMILTLSLTLWAVIPFSENSPLCYFNYSIFFIFILSTLNVYNLILAGMASNSRYALLGGVRAAAQMISYEVPMSICLMGVGMLSGSFNLMNIAIFQKGLVTFFLAVPFFLIFLICAFAETNRTPFDLPEAEAEIVAGYNLEYSSILFAFFFLAEYSNILIMSFFITILFFGVTTAFGLFFKAILFVILFIIVRACLPRYRYTQLIEICWKMLFPVSIFYLYFVALILFIFKIGPISGYDVNVNGLIKNLMDNCLGGFDAAMNEKNIEKQREFIKLLNKVLETRELWGGNACAEQSGSGVCKVAAGLPLIKKNFCYLRPNLQLNSFFILQIQIFGDGFKEYTKLGIFFLSALLFSLFLVAITWIFVPKKRRNSKNSSYECGYEPVGSPTAKFEVHFYIVAILFIIFDVELLFLYPWVIGLTKLPSYALWSMSIFLLTLLIGYGYEWLRGALDVEKKNIKKNV